MFRSKVLIVTLAVVFSSIIATNTNNVSAGNSFSVIIKKLNKIIRLLDEEVIPKLDPRGVPKTGQTTCYDILGNEIDCAGTGQDGETQYGIALPDPRFTDNEDGTVTDNFTGLMWTMDANLPGEPLAYPNAMDYVADMNESIYENFAYMDWRIPNMRELFSLVDMEYINPALTPGHPFINVQTVPPTYYELAYWTSTSFRWNPTHTWGVSMRYGSVRINNKNLPDRRHFVWPVRGGYRD